MTVKIQYARWELLLGQVSDVRTVEVLEGSVLEKARELCRLGFAVTDISETGPTGGSGNLSYEAKVGPGQLAPLRAAMWALVRSEGLDVDEQRQVLLRVADEIEAKIHELAKDDAVDRKVEDEQERMVREVAEQVERCQRNGCHLSMDACAKTFEDDWLERNKL